MNHEKWNKMVKFLYNDYFSYLQQLQNMRRRSSYQLCEIENT